MAVSERAFQQTVIQLAETLGWRVAHFHDSRRSIGNGRLVGDRQAAGFPDLVLVRRGRVLFIELKTDKGKLTAAQQDWLADLQEVEADAAGRVAVRTWRPADMQAGVVERVLLGRRA